MLALHVYKWFLCVAAKVMFVISNLIRCWYKYGDFLTHLMSLFAVIQMMLKMTTT